MKVNIIDTILLALMTALLMIGGHQIYVIGKVEGFKIGVLKSYWIFMILFVLMVVYRIRNNHDKTMEGKGKNAKVSKSAKTVSKDKKGQNKR
jgi:hypothetical protein